VHQAVAYSSFGMSAQPATPPSHHDDTVDRAWSEYTRAAIDLSDVATRMRIAAEQSGNRVLVAQSKAGLREL
jgi:hypothetical protein